MPKKRSNVPSEMSTISQWAVYQMCENFDNNYNYVLKIVKDIYPELYSKSPIDDSQRKSILGYFHESFAEFLLLKDDKKIEKEKQKPFQWSKWNKSPDKETVIDLTAEVPTNWDIYNMYQTNNGNCLQVLDEIRNEYPNFIIPEDCAEDNLLEKIFINYEKIQSILDNGGENELNEEKETSFRWKLIELRSESPDLYQYLIPEITELTGATLAEGDNNDQQISGVSSKDKSKSSPCYNELIVQAILSKPDKQLALDDIYFYITEHYPQYKAEDITWKKLVKRRLHSSRHFVMVHNSKRRTAKGCIWRIASASESKPASQTLRKSRQKAVLCSTTPNDGCSISAANSYPNSLQDGSSHCLVPEAVNTANVDNNGQQIPSESSKDNSKPPYTYVQLISQALLSVADKQLTLRKIYSYIENNYPYYKTKNKVWQNTIKHNLSFYPYFVKVPDSEEEPGTGCFWKIDPASESNLIAEVFKKRESSSLRKTRSSKLSTIAANFSSKSPDSKQCLVTEVKESVDALHVDHGKPVDAASVEGDNTGQQISNESSKNKSKPSPSYDKLIFEAISSTSNKQMTLNDIYIYISKHYPQYKAINITWKVHNFQCKNDNHCLWRMASVYKSKPKTLNRSCQKDVPCSTSLSNGCLIGTANSSSKSPDSKQCLLTEVKESVDALHVDHGKPVDAASVEGDNTGQQISNESSKDKSKPSPSYDKLIFEAISSTPNKQMTLNDIYIYISKHYPQYKAINITWKKLVKRKLCSSRQFLKVHNFQRKNDNHCLWRMASVYKSKPKTLNRSCQKDVPCSTSLSNGCLIGTANSSSKSPDSKQCLLTEVKESVDALHVDHGKPVDAASVEGDNTGQQISNESSKDKSKPSPSYDKLIFEAISSTPNKQMTLNDIYIYISKHYPQYKAINITWKKLVKRKLCSSRQFLKVHNFQNKNYNHCLWRMASVYKSKPKTLNRSCRKAVPCSTSLSNGCSVRFENSCPSGPSSSQCFVSDLEKPVDIVPVDHGKPVDVASVQSDNTGQQISSESSKDKSKPSPSYNELIIEAILSTPNKQMTLNNMYIYISKHYSQYKAIHTAWKKSLKQNLYYSGQFKKVHNSRGGRGKVCFWRIASVSESNPASRTLKGSCQNTVPCSTIANDECSIKSSAEPNSNEMQDSLKDAVAVSKNLTDRVSVNHCLSASPPLPSASLHLNPNTLPVSQVQTPSSKGIQPPPFRPSTEVSRVPLEETAPSTSHPPSIEILEGGSDDSECQNLMLSIREYENLIRNGMREIIEKDVKIERLKKQINTLSVNQSKMRQNLRRLQHQHLQKKMGIH